MGIKFHNLKRTPITVTIDASDEETRIGKHTVEPNQIFEVLPHERGFLSHVMPQGDISFSHGERSAWVVRSTGRYSVSNLDFSTRAHRRYIKSKMGILAGIGIEFTPVNKEQR